MIEKGKKRGRKGGKEDVQMGNVIQLQTKEEERKKRERKRKQKMWGRKWEENETRKE